MARLKSEPTLHKLAAFWRNDQPDGVGLVITKVLKPEIVAGAIEDGLKAYRAAAQRGELKTDDLLAQLRYEGQHKSILSTRSFEDLERVVTIMTNIAYLEEVGTIKPDNFNGMQYLYGSRR